MLQAPERIADDGAIGELERDLVGAGALTEAGEKTDANVHMARLSLLACG
jgi:hypothetical protein